MIDTKKITFLKSKQKWRYYKKYNASFWIIGYFFNFSDLEILKLLGSINKRNIKKKIRLIDGNFSIFVQTINYSFACVDRISSYPLLFSLRKNKIYLADNGKVIEEHLKIKNSDVNLSISTSFAMSGYTIDKSTIYKSVLAFLPGEYLWIENKKYFFKKYYEWQPWKVYDNKYNSTKNLLKLNEKIIKKLIKSVGNKQIVVPLSGGWDSRFIVSGLKHFGYKNVICVSYGKSDNTDMLIAKKVASKLGYKWIKIPYNTDSIRKLYYSNNYKKYEDYCDNLNSIHFISEYFMIYELKKRNLIQKDAIFVNGQSGDFISGNHIPKSINHETTSKKIVIDEYIKKHNKYWNTLINKKYKDLVKNLLKKQINSIMGKKRFKKINYYGLYETLEFYNRQVKYVINGTRNYEFFGYEWRMPLWDFEYLKYWEKISYKNKCSQKLYRDVIYESNWCDVWKDIELNPKKNINPLMNLVRFFFKAIFIFLGKDKWHKFERKYIEYFTEDLLAYKPWPWKKIYIDNRGHYSPISWYVEDYLIRKRIRWDGKISKKTT